MLLPRHCRLVRQCIDCKACVLGTHRHSVVIGRGAVPADLMMIGEGPGESEDLLGKAFVGPSGKLLDRMCRESNLDGFSIFRTNAVLCRPTDGTGAPNRTPTKKEVEACMPNVIGIVEAVNPTVIVFVGQVAERYYRRKFRHLPCFTIFHPAAILRQGEGGPYYQHNMMVLADVWHELNERVKARNK